MFHSRGRKGTFQLRKSAVVLCVDNATPPTGACPSAIIMNVDIAT